MKKLFFICTMVLMAVGVNAQSFNKGTNVVNLGVGFGTSLASGAGGGRPAFSASFERGIWSVGGPGVISLGVYGGMTGYSWDVAKLNYYIIGARGAYHFNMIKNAPKLDLYGGAMLFYNYATFKVDGEKVDGMYSGGVDFSVYAGGRWFFSKNIGAFAEVGYGVSILNAGLAFKF